MKKALFFAILGLLLLIGGCASEGREKTPPNGSADNTLPSPPFSVKLSATPFSEERISEVTVQIRYDAGRAGEVIQNVTSEAELPKGLELIEGKLSWEGSLMGKQPAEYKIKVKAVKNGEWAVKANLTISESGKSYVEGRDVLYVLAKDEAILIGETPFSEAKETAETKSIPVESYCETDNDCACGVHIEKKNCFYGNAKYVDEKEQCPDFCGGIAGNLAVRCINNECRKVLR